MSSVPRRLSVLSVAIAAACGLAVAVAPPGAASPTAAPGVVAGGEALTNYDARQGADAAQSDAIARKRAAAQVAPAVMALRGSLGGQAIVDMDGLTGTARQVARLDGFLTGTSAASADSVARGYLRAHPDVFGLSSTEIDALTLDRDYVDISGTHHLSYRQVAGGVPLFGNGVKADVSKSGRLLQVSGSPVAALQAQALPAKAAAGSAAAAIAIARTDVRETSTAAGTGDSATPVLFRTATATRRAWQAVVMSAHTPVLDVVDAASGRVLYRDLLAADAGPESPTTPAVAANRKANVVDNWPGAALGGTSTVVDLTANGWLAAGATKLAGNDAHTYTDVNDNNQADASEEIGATGTNGYRFPLKTYNVAGLPCSAGYPCTWNPNTANSWQNQAARTATQNFYFVSKYHDHLLADPIGFTEAAGNFQAVNSTGQGQGDDAVEDQALDGANTANGLPDANHIDNANFATPPDGTAPVMQMYLWHLPGTTFAQDPFVAVNGSDEADIVYHEYTHGLSHRLVVDAGNVPALDSTQGASMGEAWSDWYALDYLVDDGQLTDTAAPGDVEVGRYTVADKIDFRSEPTDCPVGTTSAKCPGTTAAGSGGYTYGDFGKISASGGPEVHADGEIWAQTLWDIRAALGSSLTESLVTRGMELSPTFPSMLDMRNAIILADTNVDGGAHVKKLWSLFAARGMGFFAGTVTGGDTAPVESFATPPAAGAAKGAISGTVTDANTGKPVKGVLVALGGHDSGLPGNSFTTTTAKNGTYTLGGVTVGTYPDLYAVGAGYDLDVAPKVKVSANATKTVDYSLLRDWAASSGGASVQAFTGVDYTDFGCGPGGDLDQSYGTGWGSTSNLDAASQPTARTAKYIDIALPKKLDASGISIDPANTCGDGLSAATGDYKVDVSKNGTTFTTVATGTFTTDDVGRLNPVTLTGAITGITVVRFWMVTPQVVTRGIDCTTGSFSGCTYMDSTEVEVYGAAA